MARMEEFIAFKAAVALAVDRGKEGQIMEIYRKCKAQESLPKEDMKNYVKDLYDSFTQEEISEKIVELLRPQDVKTEIHIVYQTLEGLRTSCPNSPGDWYFSGNYPTPGGIKRINQAYINYIEEIYTKI